MKFESRSSWKFLGIDGYEWFWGTVAFAGLWVLITIAGCLTQVIYGV